VHVCAALCHGRVKGNNRKPGNYQREAFHHSLLGTVLSCNVEYARSIADYDEAIRLKNGNYPAAHYNRALAYADKGEYELSLRDFDIVMLFDQRNALALYARGLTLLKKGDTEAGKNDISAAKAIDPNIAEKFDHSESLSR
jgi:tetratricopeptide (TPR) repeat protein